MRVRKLRMRIYGVISVSLATALLAGCGSSKATPSNGSNTPPAAITGLATPSTVSVVTATNVH
jgi:uncharacterized lipoprotein YajG